MSETPAGLFLLFFWLFAGDVVFVLIDQIEPRMLPVLLKLALWLLAASCAAIYFLSCSASTASATTGCAWAGATITSRRFKAASCPKLLARHGLGTLHSIPEPILPKIALIPIASRIQIF